MSVDLASVDELERLEAEGRWWELVKALGQHAEVAPATEQVALQLRIATICQGRFANAALAIKAYEQVLVHDPGNRQATTALRALFEQRRDWERLLELEKHALDHTAPDRRADKALDVARVAASRLSKPDLQLYWWERVREHDPAQRQAITELTRLYAHTERWPALAELLRDQADRAAGNDERAAALRTLACVHAAHLGDHAAATTALEQLLAIEPGDRHASRILAALRARRPVAWVEGYRIGVLPPVEEAADHAEGAAPPGRHRTLGIALALALVLGVLVVLAVR